MSVLPTAKLRPLTMTMMALCNPCRFVRVKSFPKPIGWRPCFAIARTGTQLALSSGEFMSNVWMPLIMGSGVVCHFSPRCMIMLAFAVQWQGAWEPPPLQRLATEGGMNMVPVSGRPFTLVWHVIQREQQQANSTASFLGGSARNQHQFQMYTKHVSSQSAESGNANSVGWSRGPELRL